MVLLKLISYSTKAIMVITQGSVMSVYQSTCSTSHTSIPTAGMYLPYSHWGVIGLTDQKLFVRKIHVGLSKQVRACVHTNCYTACVVSDLEF